MYWDNGGEHGTYDLGVRVQSFRAQAQSPPRRSYGLGGSGFTGGFRSFGV